MSAPDVLTGTERVDDPETRVATVRSALSDLDARLDRIDGQQVTPEQRTMLVTLVLSLDEMVRDLEGQLGGAPSSTATAKAKSRWTRRPTSPQGSSNVDIDTEYRRDLSERVEALRRGLDESAGRILIVTGGGQRRRWGWGSASAVGVEAAPSTGPLSARALATLRDRKALLLAIGKGLTAAGVVALLFLVFEFGLTGVLQDRDQRVLLEEFRLGIVTTKLGQPNVVNPPGSAVALLQIPRIHLEEVVVEGTTTQLLKMGPGHFRATPLPGEFGNVVIAGHRTTYGAPFRQLNLLRPGDTISATTGQGAFIYIVQEVHQILPGQPDVFTGSPDSRLTLISSDPPYQAKGRFAVVAMLQGDPVAVAARPPVPVGGNELGLASDPIGAVLALLWAQVLFLVVWGARRLYRRWNRPVTYLLATPIALAVLLMMFENLDRLLPGTL